MEDDFERVLAIQRTGSRELRDSLLRDLKPEAERIAWIHCLKHGRAPTDEELVEALLAANEAIDGFDQRKNGSFKIFLGKVIGRRLIDFFRKEKREECAEEGVEYDIDNDNITLLTDKKANTDRELSENLRDELVRFNKIIGNLGYKWSDVMRNRPTRRDALDKLQSIALHIVHLRLGERYLKEFPMSRELRKLIGADQRTLKKYRPYLCALVIVFLFNLRIIRNHLDSFRKEVQRYGATQRNSRRGTR